MANNKSTQNFTKVVCQNCGAEVIIPANEHVAVGTVIGEDSGLGTIILPTVNNTGSHSAIEQLMAIAEHNPKMMALVKEVAEQINDGGYIDVQGIVRRWLPAQCLSMQFSNLGFHKALLSRGYMYSWDVLLNDLKTQVKMTTDGDMVGFHERNRWYNQNIAIEMAQHFIFELRKDTAAMPKFSHKNRQYIKLRCWLNKGMGVHTDELNIVYGKFTRLCNSIVNAETPIQLYQACAQFAKQIKMMEKYRPESAADAFLNAYKAAGAYFTMKDLILFEGCKFAKHISTKYGRVQVSGFMTTDQSLEELETIADATAINVESDGYKLLGTLRVFLEENNFNFTNTKEKWLKQSEARKAARRNVNRRTR